MEQFGKLSKQEYQKRVYNSSEEPVIAPDYQVDSSLQLSSVKASGLLSHISPRISGGNILDSQKIFQQAKF